MVCCDRRMVCKQVPSKSPVPCPPLGLRPRTSKHKGSRRAGRAEYIDFAWGDIGPLTWSWLPISAFEISLHYRDEKRGDYVPVLSGLFYRLDYTAVIAVGWEVGCTTACCWNVCLIYFSGTSAFVNNLYHTLRVKSTSPLHKLRLGWLLHWLWFI